MNITLTGTKIQQDNKNLAFEKNNLVDVINVTVDTNESWSYKLDIKYPQKCCTGEQLYNIIDMTRTGNVATVELTAAMLPFSGKYVAQLRGIDGDKVYHSDTFDMWVKYSIEPGSTYDPVPSEFYQIEENITEANKHPPKPGSNGYWLIWNTITKQYDESDIALPEGTLPEVSDATKGWYLSNDGERVYWAEVQGGSGEGDITAIQVNGIDQPIVDKVAQLAISNATVGLGNLDNVRQYSPVNPPPYPVTSVDGSTGDVVTLSVKYTEQALTAAQQQHARENIGAGTPYVLPMADATTLGGVKPVAKTDDMTGSVGVDENGQLWVKHGADISTIPADKVMFDSDLVFTYQFGKYTPTGGKVIVPADNKSLLDVLNDAYSEDKNPTVTQPTVSVSSTTARAYEVGTSVTPQYSAAFNAGRYEYGPNPTGAAITAWLASNNLTADTRDTQTGTFSSYIVPDGSAYRITVSGTYGDGQVPVTALGKQYPAGQIKGTTKSAQTGLITGYRNSFYGTLTDKTTTINSAAIRGLAQKSGRALANGNTFTVNIPVNAQVVLIAYPATLRDVTSIKDVNGLNADITSAFTKSAVNVEGAAGYTAISYKVYRLDFAKPNDTANKYTVTI